MWTEAIHKEGRGGICHHGSAIRLSIIRSFWPTVDFDDDERKWEGREQGIPGYCNTYCSLIFISNWASYDATCSDLTPLLFLSQKQLSGFWFRSYCSLIFISNWAMTLLVQILLDSYFWHRSNFQASYSDLIAVLFSSNWAMLLLVQILFDSYFWHRSNFQASYSDLIAVLF